MSINTDRVEACFSRFSDMNSLLEAEWSVIRSIRSAPPEFPRPVLD
jgi:hypothetical protein